MNVRLALMDVIKCAPILKGHTHVLVAVDLNLVQMASHALVCTISCSYLICYDPVIFYRYQ